MFINSGDVLGAKELVLEIGGSENIWQHYIIGRIMIVVVTCTNACVANISKLGFHQSSTKSTYLDKSWHLLLLTSKYLAPFV